MVLISYLIGINVASLSYYLFLRSKVKTYMAVPLTMASFAVSKNLSMVSFIDRIYYPIEPSYREIRKHKTVSE